MAAKAGNNADASKRKSTGQVFTPTTVVDEMLDAVGYVESNAKIIYSTIMEPSFGKGVFLLEAIRRLVSAARASRIEEWDIPGIIDNNIWGMELDEKLYAEAIDAINSLCIELNVSPGVSLPHLWRGNALDAIGRYDKAFAYVVGNPPYVRPHHLSPEDLAKVKSLSLTTGTTDLYIAFFEMCISMLDDDGKLAFITPNSFMKNTSQKAFRSYLLEHGLLRGLTDYRSVPVFEDASTYATITYLERSDAPQDISYLLESPGATLSTSIPYASLIADRSAAWNFADPLGVLASQPSKSRSFEELGTIQYGLTTLRNDVYFDAQPSEDNAGVTLFHGIPVETELLRPVTKASKYRGDDVKSRAIFPYIETLSGGQRPLTEDELSTQYPLAYAYFVKRRSDLDGRSLDSGAVSWFQYGRSQAVNSANLHKMSLGHVISPNIPPVAYALPVGCLTYSGMFIVPRAGVKADDINAVISTPDFLAYCHAVGKDMSGGFVAITPTNVRAYRF